MRSEAFWTWFDAEARPRLVARADTFAKMFEHLDAIDRPVTIVETGCARRDPADDDSWRGDGCSTILFDRYVEERPEGCFLLSVDLDQAAVAACSAMTSIAAVHHGDSIKFLTRWASRELRGRRIDLLYLDSMDFVPHDPLPSAIHHHAELMAAMPAIGPGTLVVVDDSPATLDADQRAEVGGKGLIVARHMDLCGADFAFCSYQTGWTNVGPARKRDDADLGDLVARARRHVERDDAVAAEHLYRLILGLTTPPRSGRARVAHGEACAFYAKMALARQRLGSAADWYREALMADPLATQYRLDLVLKCFLPMGALRNALLEAERATSISPDMPDAWKVLGGIHHELNDAPKALAAYERQIDLLPGDPDALLDMATMALDLGNYDKVRECCNGVVGSERKADGLHCMAMVAYRNHLHEEAIELYDLAIERGCRDPAMAHWNKSLALHAIGRYREGWVEHEWREHQRGNPALYLPMKRFTLPRWKGEGPRSASHDRPAVIHVHYEAGAGDNLCLVRYLNVLVDWGFEVRYECAPEMMTLIQHSMPNVKVLPKAPDYPGALGIEAFDYHIPIGSLPAVLGTDIDSVPWPWPYLKADPASVREVEDRLRRTSVPHNGRIGLCWSSGIREGIWMREYGTRKSMHFRELCRLLDGTGRKIGEALAVSLQVGPERAQHDKLIADVLPQKPTWAETAALIECLDLVITVDTAVAHLAGAMGKPVWLMCQRDGCSWHFMCWRPGAPWNEASPWYPTMRIFRQREFDKPHHWEEVVGDVAAALAEWGGRIA